MASLVIPEYQVALLREKQSLGKDLTPQEMQVVENHPPVVLNLFLQFLKDNRKEKFEKILNEVKVIPIKNYRETYNLAQLLIQAYHSRLLSELPKSDELTRFTSAYSSYNNMNYFYKFATYTSLVLFNVAYTVPRGVKLPVALVQNVALWYIFTSYNNLVNDHNWVKVVPHLHQASLKHSEDLKKWHNGNKVLYQYQNFFEEFPPDEFKFDLIKYLNHVAKYNETHLGDFESTGRRHSQLVYGKSLKHKLPE